MKIRQVVDGVAVSEQISPLDVNQVAAEGFRSIISNRPDGEAADQPAYAEIKLAAGRNGLQIRHIPIVSGQMSLQDVETFGRALEELPAPVLAYCRSGTRSVQLWALASARSGADVDEILKAATQAGYNLADLEGTLRQLARQQ